MCDKNEGGPEAGEAAAGKACGFPRKRGGSNCWWKVPVIPYLPGSWPRGGKGLFSLLVVAVVARQGPRH